MGDLAIAVTGLTKSFAGQQVVRGIDLEVKRGEIFAFVGPNGSGKTTTIRMLCGLLTPDAGEGHCLGFDVRQAYDEIKLHSGYMSQGFSLYGDLTVVENLRFAARIHQLDGVSLRVSTLLTSFQLEPYADHLAASLSGGWKQRLSLAAALMHAPSLLLLDEPTGGVDPESRRSFWRIIREKAAEGVAVLVSTHYLDEVAMYADRLAYIHTGRVLVHGSLQQVIDQIALTAYRLPLLPAEQLAQLEQERAVATAEVMMGSVVVTGEDRDALTALLSDYHLLAAATEIQPGFEDLFFYLARQKGEP